MPPAHSLSRDELLAAKATQEANRAARLRQLHTPAEVWRRQQAALADLAKLRPAEIRQRRRRKEANHA
jgi:hypothetical protein